MDAVKNSETQWKDLGGGLKRKVLSHNQDIMVVEVAFETGGVGPAHSHPHVQCTYILSGAFVFTGSGKEVTVTAGDALAFERNEIHSCVCKAAGSLVDVFSPQREDFLSS